MSAAVTVDHLPYDLYLKEVNESVSTFPELSVETHLYGRMPVWARALRAGRDPP